MTRARQHPSFDAPETVFGREYNEDLVHQIVVAFTRPTRARAPVPRRDREQVKHHKKPFQEGYRPRSCRYDLFSAVARRRSHLPEHADENFGQKSTRRCTAPAWHPSCRSWCP